MYIIQIRCIHPCTVLLVVLYYLLYFTEAILQRAYAQKWEQIQRAKAIQELAAQKMASQNAEKNIEKVELISQVITHKDLT